MSQEKKPRNPDHVRRVNVPGPQDETRQQPFEARLSPAIAAQSACYRSLNLRDRSLNSPLMIAAILTMLWRPIPSVCAVTKTLNRAGALWMRPAKVAQPALRKRLLPFPAELFERVLSRLWPQRRERWQARGRPLPASVRCALPHLERIYAVDGATLATLLRTLDALHDAPAAALVGTIGTVIDLAPRLPEHMGSTANVMAHDTNVLAQIRGLAHASAWWRFDCGFSEFPFFDARSQSGSHCITRLQSTAVVSVPSVLCHTTAIRDCVILLGGANSACHHTLRLIDMRFGSTWYSYLTSVLDPATLPANVVADRYRRRWRSEAAFVIVKRLLHLASLWTGSLNGLLRQVWATWLCFALLIDWGDAVAEELMFPFDRISLAMVFRGLYHFTQAHHRGEAPDPITSLSAPENQDLGVVKRLRKKSAPALAQSTA